MVFFANLFFNENTPSAANVPSIVAKADEIIARISVFNIDCIMSSSVNNSLYHLNVNPVHVKPLVALNE